MIVTELKLQERLVNTSVYISNGIKISALKKKKIGEWGWSYPVPLYSLELSYFNLPISQNHRRTSQTEIVSADCWIELDLWGRH